MNVKELLLSQKKLELIGHVINMFNEKEQETPGYYTTLMDIEKLEPIEDKNKLIYAYKYREIEDGKIVERKDCSLIYIDELSEMDENGEINALGDGEKVNYPTSYAFEFVDWKEVIGYQIATESFDEISEMDLAALILYELTFFGYGYEENKEESEAEIEELERRVEEIQLGNTENYKTIDLENWFMEMRKENGEFDGKTEEEIQEIRRQERIEHEKEMEINRKLMLEDLNKRYKFLKELKRKYC